MATKQQFNFSQHQHTGNKAIDLVGNLIGCARHHNMPIKQIDLSPIYYEWFKSGAQTLMNRPLEDGELIQFDGVNINKGSRFQSKPAIIDYYPQNPELN